jgi:tRNA (adenine57-N1/adenine58-N1)-methyltransferase catalytic subunit
VSGPFEPGQRALLVDARGRRYLIALVAGGQFHTHLGIVEHDDLIGRPEGAPVQSSGGSTFDAVRPTLADIVVEMPRGAQVIYPKDLAAILMMSDVFPGARVLEAGVGSGALSLALLRAGARVVGYETRADFAARARRNVEETIGDASYRVEIRDVYEGIDESDLDRIVLDLPEPWRVLPHASASLAAGGIITCFLPTINQVISFRKALDDSLFGMALTREVLERSWQVRGQSVRPAHRMVAHTGFLTSARLLRPG